MTVRYTVSWNLINCCTTVCKIPKACSRWMSEWTWRNWRSFQAIYHFLLVFCSNVSVLHHFWDILTFTVYLKSTSFDKTLDSWNYKLHARSNSCVNISQLIHIIFLEVSPKGFKQQKWPSVLLEAISIDAIW